MNTLAYPEYSIFDGSKFEQKSSNFKTNFFPDFLSPAYGAWSDYDKARIKESYRIAIEAHSGQERKSEKAYITHIDDMLSRAKKQSKIIDTKLTPDDIIIEILHDSLEDHPEYFDEIYQKYGYAILVSILGLSKPSKDLYNKWTSMADREKQESTPYEAELYKFWTTVIENWDNPSLPHKVLNVSKIIYQKYDENVDAPSDIFLELQRIYNAYTIRLDELRYMPYSTPKEIEEKDKISDKRWQEYTAELQLFLNTKDNFKRKTPDKEANLGDIAFHNGGGSIRKKSESILSSMYSYYWLIKYHKLEKLIPEFTQLEMKFRASLALNSLASGFPSQRGLH